MDYKVKYKKCPYCELNYIKLEEECCEVCYSQFPPAREAAKIKRGESPNQTIKIEDARQKENRIRKELLELMREKGFIGFLRTENFDNFIKIYKSGYIKSRERVLRENVEFTDNADPDVLLNTSDYIKKQVRFYLRYKTPTNYGAYFYFGQNNPVMLIFDENLIFNKDAIFCDGNAMASQTKRISFAEYALNTFKWDEIFSFGPFEAGDFIKKNHRNAEFLLPDQVSIDHIKHIYFKYEDDLNKAIKLLGNDKRFKYNPDVFFRRGK